MQWNRYHIEPIFSIYDFKRADWTSSINKQNVCVFFLPVFSRGHRIYLVLTSFGDNDDLKWIFIFHKVRRRMFSVLLTEILRELQFVSFSQIANETNSVSDANLSHFRINCLWNIRTDWIYILNHTVRWCAHYQSDNEVFLSIDSNTFSLCTCNRCCRCCVASYCSSARIKCLFHSFFCVGLRCDWRLEWLIRATKTVRY